ncbi:MAG: hypothetical protein WC734_06355 [Patescibacteria group bacterium]|jgi:hypothetical protein
MAGYIEREFQLIVSGLDCIVRGQDGNWEQYLFDNTERINEALPEYWAGLTLMLGDNEKVKTRDLLELRSPDLNQIAIEIFRAGTLTDSIILRGKCSECKKSVNWAKDLATLDFMPIPDDKTGPDPTFEFTTPQWGTEVVWGYLTGQQELEQRKIPGFNPTRQTWKAIRSVNGRTDFTLKEVLAWPIADQEAIRGEIEDKQCGYDPRIWLEHTCGSEVVINLLGDPSFMMPGIHSAARRSRI